MNEDELLREIEASMPQRDASDERRFRDSAGAVVFRKTAEGLKVLMIVMRKTLYSFPKGHIEDGESLEACALREVAEETGAQVRLLPDFHYQVPSVLPGDKRIVHFFLGEVDSEDACELVPQFGEVENALWVDAKNATEMVAFREDRLMYEAAYESYLSRL